MEPVLHLSVSIFEDTSVITLMYQHGAMRVRTISTYSLRHQVVHAVLGVVMLFLVKITLRIIMEEIQITHARPLITAQLTGGWDHTLVCTNLCTIKKLYTWLLCFSLFLINFNFLINICCLFNLCHYGDLTLAPSGQPSIQPSGQPSARPSNTPTNVPSRFPSRFPSIIPSSMPSSYVSSGTPTHQPGMHMVFILALQNWFCCNYGLH